VQALYRSDWLARKIVDTPAFDSTRAWRQWEAEADQIEALEEAERSFGLQRKLLEALTKARLYGGAAMVLGVKGTPFNKELDVEKVGKGDLKFIHVVERWMIQAGPVVRDITSPWFGEPSYYMRSNIPVIEAPGNVTPVPASGLGYEPDAAIYIHPSRVVRLIGLDYPDMETAPDAWGDSVLQPVYDAIRDAGLVTQSLANLVADMKVDVYKIPGLSATLSTAAGTQKMLEYFSQANVAKSTVNSLILDKDYDWERISTHLEGLPEVLQAYLMIASGAADIPSTRLLGREPTGQNSTGESDIRNYYDRLSSDQKVRLTPLLSRLDEVLIRHTFGSRDPDIHYEWNSLWQMSDTEKAAITLQKAQAFKIDADAGLVPPEALRVGREDQLIEDGVYPGLEAALDAYEKIMQEQVDNDDVKPTAGPKPPQPAGPFGNKTNANEGKPNGNGANGGAPPKAPPKKSLPNKKINAPKEKTEA
jgi:hypothetical protein